MPAAIKKMKPTAKRSKHTVKPAILAQFVDTIREHQLFVPGQHLLVAVSGGPDSVALLSLLAGLAPSWRLKLTAVHFNYQLRGKESEGDEAFVVELCRQNNIPLVVRRPVLLGQKGQSSLQALARDARYAAMKSIAYEIKADRIVVGHTANDQAETVLMWMLRGAGLRGLSGMPFIREEMVVRPLLAVTKAEVLTYLKRERLGYRLDSSNESARFRRNRIRHEVMPVLEHIAPAAIHLLRRQADLLREDEQYLEGVVESLYASMRKPDALGGDRIDRQSFLAVPLALRRRLIRRMLRQADPERRACSARTIERVQRFMVSSDEGASMSVMRLEITHQEGAVIRIGASGPSEQKSVTVPRSEQEMPVSIPSTLFWPGTKQEIHVQEVTNKEAKQLSKNAGADYALFDASLLSEPLAVRSWQPGDRFYPTGMKGRSKKLQDFFIDAKVSRRDRTRIPLLVAPEGIVWVVGRRADERFVAGGKTSRYLVATVKSATGSGGVK
ncbi:tRNA lysidine(34) synthetase TilS [Petrachloros mirabilis]